MRHRINILLYWLTGLHFLAVYGFMVFYWVENIRTGAYSNHHAEAFSETLLLVVYSALGIHFLAKRLGIF